MEKEQALTIIEQALNIAIGKGVFKTEDSATVLTAFITVKNLLSLPTETLTEAVGAGEVGTPIKESK